MGNSHFCLSVWKVDKLLTHKTFTHWRLYNTHTHSHPESGHAQAYISVHSNELCVAYSLCVCVSLINIKNVRAKAFIYLHREREWADEKIDRLVKITSLNSVFSEYSHCYHCAHTLFFSIETPWLNSNNIKINSFPFIVLTFDVCSVPVSVCVCVCWRL